MLRESEAISKARANYDGHLQSRFGGLSAVAATGGPPSETYRKHRTACEVCQSGVDDIRRHLGNREVQILLTNKMIFYVGLIVLLVLEVFINKPLFDMILLQSSGVSIIATLFLAICLVASAHFAGFSVRQIWSDKEEKLLADRLLLGLFLIFLTSAIILSIMYSRALYASSAIQTSGFQVFGEIARSILAGGVGEFFRMAVSTTESLMMGLVNGAALALAFVIAFLSHDSDKEYDARYRKLLAANKKFDRVRARYAAEIKNVHRKHELRIKNARESFVSAGGDVGSLAKDDLRAQLALAERAPPDVVNSPLEPPHSEEGQIRNEEKPDNNRGMTVVAGGKANPW